jgi:hypothetical protein
MACEGTVRPHEYNGLWENGTSVRGPRARDECVFRGVVNKASSKPDAGEQVYARINGCENKPLLVYVATLQFYNHCQI